MKIKKGLSAVGRVGNIFCIACIAVEMVVVFADVLLRLLFNHPLQGVTELAQTCWLLMSLSFGSVALHNDHTKVDIFVNMVRPAGRKIVQLINDLAAVFFCVVAGWQTVDKALSCKSSHSMFYMLGIKEWPIVMLFALAFLIAAACFVVVAVDEWKNDDKNEDPKPVGNVQEGGE